MALAPYALSTPARVRSAQGWSESAYPDAKIIPKINSISKKLAEVTGRRFGFQTFPDNAPMFLSGTGSPDLWLPFPLIRTLSAVAIQGQALTVYTFTLEGPSAHPEGVFRTPDWDAEGRLFRPHGWPRGGFGTWNDLTDHTYSGGFRGWTVSLAGNFGYVLPQYHGVENETYNPAGDDTDIPTDLEQLVFDLVEESVSTKSGNIKREKTAGGWEVEFSDSAGSLSALQRRVVLMERLGPYLMPEALWAG